MAPCDISGDLPLKTVPRRAKPLFRVSTTICPEAGLVKRRCSAKRRHRLNVSPKHQSPSRGNGIFVGGDKGAERAPDIHSTTRRDKACARIAASSGSYSQQAGKSLFARDCVVGWEDSNLQPNDYQPPALSIGHSARLAESPGDHSAGKSMRRALVHSCLGNNRLVRSSSPPCLPRSLMQTQISRLARE